MHEDIINQRVKIEYFDQNEDFSLYLPKTGIISRRLTADNEIDSWFLVNLDDPFEYQIKIKDPFEFKLLNVSKFLIRSRWEGKSISKNNKVSVFVLLVLDDSLLLKDNINIDAFYHVAWGMCEII